VPTLSIFFIGTGHTREETSNILFALHSLVNAVDVSPGGAQGASPTDVHFKMLFDGAKLGATQSDAVAHLPKMSQVVAEFLTPAMDVITALQTLRLHTAANPWILNLVGHSRGAISCMALADELHTRNNQSTVNMFLIDPVRRVANAPPEFGITVRSNTHEFCEIIMEDDFHEVVFELSEVILPTTGNPILRKRIRLAGTHGTATQCNEIQNAGKKIPTINFELPTKRLWPIGGVALRTILEQLRRWGTPLTRGGDGKIGQIPGLALDDGRFRRILLTEYWRIAAVNQTTDGKRWVNNVGKSKPDEVQEFKQIQGTRTEAVLSSRGVVNPFRDTNVFVNLEHFVLFQQFLTSISPTVLPNADVLPSGRRFSLELRRALLSGTDLTSNADAAERAAISRLLCLILDLDKEGFHVLANSPRIRFAGQGIAGLLTAGSAESVAFRQFVLDSPSMFQPE
jgi:hypothetical protein